MRSDGTAELFAIHGSKAVNARGIVLAWSGDIAGAEAAFREADEAGSSAASFNLAQLLAKQGNDRGAIEAFRRAVSRGHVVAGYALGEFLAESGDIEGSIEAYRVTAERGHPIAAYELGLLYRDRGDLESAGAAFERADELGHAWAALELGEVLEQAGDRDGAIAAFWRAADRNVASARARLEALLAGTGNTDEPIAPSRDTGEVALAEPESAAPPGRVARWAWIRRRLAWIVGVVAALAAILTVALLALLSTASPRTAAKAQTPPAVTARHQPGSGHRSGNTSGGGNGRGGATNSTSTPLTRGRTGGIVGQATQGGAARSPATSFTTMQSALLANVPDLASARCLPGAGEPVPHAAASIRCVSASTGVTALYYRYSSPARLRRLFHNYRTWFAGRHALRDCAGRTHGAYYQGVASTITGRWACFYNDRKTAGSACIDWADYALVTFASACQAGGDFTALAAWWKHAGPVPASSRALTNRA